MLQPIRSRAAHHVSAAATRARNYRRRTADGALLMHLVAGLAIIAAFVLFLRGSQWTVLPVAAFLVTAAIGWRRHQAELVKGLAFLTTVVTVSILSLIIVFLLLRSAPIVEHMGFTLLTDTTEPLWTSSSGGVYTLAPMMVGTALTTVLATILAAPLGVAGAVFISEIASPRVRDVVKPGVELMAGIPSITYGFIGLTIVNQYFYTEFRTPTIGSYFAAGIMIGIMALPTVVSVAEDALSTVPESMKRGSLAMGSTDWQTTKSVTIPAAMSGVSAGVLLGVGRAMGETMAATVMLSHTKGFPTPVFDVFTNYGETLTTVIAFEAGNASGVHLSALFAAGVVLFGMVMVLSIASQWVEWRMHRKLGGENA